MTDNSRNDAKGAATDPQLNAGRPASETQQWDRPGRDGVVGDQDTDPDRRDLRAEIGKYVSLVQFPASAGELTEAAAANGAADTVTSALRALEPKTRFENTRDLWIALDLEAPHRF